MTARTPARTAPGAMALGALALAALGLLAGCSQEPLPAAGAPKASAVVPTSAAASTTAAPSTTAAEQIPRDPNIRTIDDVRAVLTADGTIDVNQADCLVNNLVGAIGEAGTIDVFAIGDVTKAADDRRAAAQAAFEACVPKQLLLRPIGQGVQEAARTRGVEVTATQVDCITAQLAAVVSYDDLLSGPASDGTGGIPESVATLAVRMCLPADVLAQLGLT